MTRLHPALDAALSGDRVTIFGALQVDFPGRTVRLLDGSGVATFGGATFTGEDAVFGAWGGVDDITDGAGDEAPSLSFTLLPAPDTTAAQAANAAMQGARVQLWLGAQDPQTGTVIGDPLLLFDGEVDVPILAASKGTLRVDFDCVGGMERFFENEEGIRLAPTWHKQVWPGELGLDHVTGVKDTVYWGQNAPSGVKT